MTSELYTCQGQAVSYLGLAGNPSMESRCVDRAFEAGISYFFFYNLSFQPLIAGLNRLCKDHRDEVFVATGTEGRDEAEMHRYFESAKRRLDTEFVDLFFAQYVAPSEDWDDVVGALDVLQSWKAAGKVGAVGATVHSRELALELIYCGKVDVLMHRYNMAHRRSEEEVLPAALDADIPVISFTNTRWGSLLQGHRQWDGPVPEAADCYRYVLHNPAVRVALTAPSSVIELEGNLSVLSDRTVEQAQLTSWQAYGDLVYGDGSDDFETRWP